MITLDQAKELYIGQIVYHVNNRNADGTPQRWKINGKVKTWKRTPSRVSIPIKHGLYSYDYITENDFHLVSLSEEKAQGK